MYEATCCSGECICPHDRFRPRDGGLLFFCFVCQAEYLEYHSHTYTNSHSCVYTHPYTNPNDPYAHSIADAYASCQRSICPLLDVASWRTLLNVNSHMHLPMWSTTKLMTNILAIQL